jgi:hypothetical protein
MSTWPNRGVPPAAWQGPEDKKQQPKTHSPNRLTHRNTDSPPEVGLQAHGISDFEPAFESTTAG